VEDLARAHVLALGDAGQNQTYNLDGREKITIRRIAETVLRLVTSESKLEFGPARPGDYAGKDVNSQKAQRELGWTPEIGFDEGMRRTVPWLVERLGSEISAQLKA
jgi:UDP-glucose 4-epimerase